MKDKTDLTRSRFLATTVACLIAFGLAACGGSDGDRGPAGADGSDGADGSAGLNCWDLNENGIPDFPDEDTNGDGVIDVNDCRADGPPIVDDGLDISDPDVLAKVDGFEADITGIEVSSPPVVSFTLATSEGVPVVGLGGVGEGIVRGTFAKLVPPGDGFPSRWESYINRVEEAGSGDTPDVLDQSVQATNDGGTGVLTDLGGGEYTYEYGIDVTDVTDPVKVVYEEGLTHQAGLEIRIENPDTGEDLDPVNPTITFVPDGSDPLDTKFIATEMTCNNCHIDLAIHGGHRKATNYCVTCHNPGSIDQDTGESVDMAYMVHSIHVGEARGEAGFPYTIYGFRDSRHNYGECVEDEESGEEVCTGVVHPQPVTYCSNCHEDSDVTPDGDDWLTNSSASVCGGCHIDGLVVASRDKKTGQPTYQFSHFGGSFTADDGSCSTCHVEGGPAGANADFHENFAADQAEKFAYQILDVKATSPGQKPKITFAITDPTNGNERYDIFEAGGPWDTEKFGGDTRLAIDIAWSATDFFNAETGSEVAGFRPGSPGQSVSINPLASGAAEDLGNNKYRVVSPVPVPDWVTGTLAVGIEGHPAVVDDDGETVEVPATGALDFFAVTDGSPVPRREIVTIEQCNNCHEKLSLHGNNRTDNIDLCASCHNPSATDIRARQEAIDRGTFDEEAKHEESIDFKRMVHQIHAANTVLYGFGGGVHDYTHVEYPAPISDCTVCHAGETYYPVDGSVLATTIWSDPTETEGRTPERAAALADQADDLNTTANTAVCTSCHTSDFAVGHMEQNGGVVASQDAGVATQDPMTGELNPGVIETCALCHAEGGIADVAEAHGLK